MAGSRELLQEYQKLAGIGVGGWITLSVLAGMLLGSALTLFVQYVRRRKQLRYMDAAPYTTEYRSAASLHKPTLATPAMQLSSAAPLKPRLPAAPGAQPKYYSPLTKSMSFVGAGLQVQASHGGSRLMEAGADTNSRGLQDQAQLSGSCTNPFAAPVVRILQPFAEAAPTGGPAAVSAAVSAAVHGRRATQHCDQVPQQPHLASGAPCLQAPHQSGFPASTPDTATEYQLPASIIPTDGRSSAVSPASSSPVEGHSNIHQQQWMQQQQQPVPAGSGIAVAAMPGAHAAAALAVASSEPAANSAAAGETGRAASNLRAQPSAAESEIADEYEEADLDDDWRALLNDVDARLLAQGARAMDAPERAVAIKKMLVATGTRGVDFAMHGTVQEVLSYRRFRGS